MNRGLGLNASARVAFENARCDASGLRIAAQELPCGAQILDFGVQSAGGIEAGLLLAKICMAGKARIEVTGGDRMVWAGPWIQVTTDHPIEACMLGQYAGWPIKHGDIFAMGSGAMRVLRGREHVLEELSAKDDSEVAVGTMECDGLPNCELVESLAAECGVKAEGMHLAVAPTRSVAGCVQVVARSVETSLHKLFEMGFPLGSVRHAFGLAPLPPPTPDFTLGIGRTNDAILYGGHVTLWVDTEDALVEEFGPRVPSSTSRDFGAPFAEVFKRYDYDFYQVDPGLFSPAEVMILNLRTGTSWRFGELREDLLANSFATEMCS